MMRKYIEYKVVNQVIVAYIEEKTAKIDTAISKAEQEIKLTKEYMESLKYNSVTGKIKI
jgi:hypothetical protein